MRKTDTDSRKLCKVILPILAMLIITGCTDDASTSEAEYSASLSETISSFSSASSAASEISTPPSEEPSTTSCNFDTENVRYGILYDISKNNVLWTKSADSKIPPASLTKLLTAYTSLQYVPKDTVFTVGSEQELVNPESSLCLIREGHRLTLYDLICGMLIASGNDAAYTVAVNTARYVYDKTMTDDEAVKAFCDLMNREAKKIGMRYSNFCNPDGWDDVNHYTTVNDLLKLSLCAYKNNDIRTIAGQSERYVVFSSGQNVTWENTNSLLHSSSEYYFPYATGLKTGTTDNAGNCLIATAQKSGKDFIVIAMGCDTDAQRYAFAIHMLNEAFKNEETASLEE